MLNNNDNYQTPKLVRQLKSKYNNTTVFSSLLEILTESKSRLTTDIFKSNRFVREIRL